ncbi:MAG TPA: universal stress protein [Beijerinckiaceae bacterium]|jgi:nucleotide-binding universal stress UspA family protein
MSLKDLLVVLDADGRQGPAHAFAQSLAARSGAHLTAAGLALQYVAPVSFSGDYPYDLLAQATEQSRRSALASYEALKAQAAAGVSTDLVMIETVAGMANARLGELARHFDLAIVGQDDLGGVGDEGGLIVALLMGSGRPVFVVPYIHRGPAKLDHAMVAWDGGLVAARALAGAMPLLQGAQRVEVVTMAPRDLPPEELPGFNITRHLSRHGVKAELRQIPAADDVGAALLSHASDTGADYLVMGGYGHSRFREFMLGGATRSVLSSMTLPVLMAH